MNVSQKSVSGEYVYSVRINGQVVKTLVNNNVRQYVDVKFFIGDDAHGSLNGYIRDLSMDGE